ncbi:MAG: sigma-54-dependent transcriptional regulator [Desulfovibrionales bacterium]
MAQILIVDDDQSLREVLDIALTKQGHRAWPASRIKEGLDLLSQKQIDMALVDLRIGTENGIDLLRSIRERWPELPVLMITAYADSATAVEAIKLGARDYISKPFDLDEFILLVERTLENSRLVQENAWLKDQMEGIYGPIIGQCSKMLQVYDMVKRIAPTTINVLITGESGTGKELIARALHTQSTRKKKAYMAINCGGLPDTLVESELFGFRRGAFTGADRPKKGLLEIADGGTVFLDEVGELSASTQVKLLRVIQERTFIPLGATEEIRSDVRIIAATNRPVDTEVQEGRFREDLFYRLSGVILHLPPLRERGQDILLLADHFLARANRDQKRDIKGFTQEAREKLSRYHYPGNVRELENIIERAVALEQTDLITPYSLIIYEQHQPQTTGGPDYHQVINGRITLDEYLEQIESNILESALERTGGHKGKAAELVGLNFRQFRYRLSKFAPQEGSAGQSD